MSKSIYALVFALTAGSLIDLNAHNAIISSPDEAEPPLFVQRRQVFINTELLAWTVEETPLDYALRMNSPAWGPSPAFAKGRYKTAELDWAPGFRLGIGWFNQPRYWEIMWQYTQLFTSGSNDSHKPKADDDFLVSTWNIMTPAPLRKAESHISFHYRVADMIVSRVFDTNPHLRMRLIAGLTTSWMDQVWKIRYFDFNQNEDLIKNFWHYWGTGFRMGLSADWFWSGHFYFTGKITFATLMGAYRNKVKQSTTYNQGNPANDTDILVRNATYRTNRFAFQNQFQIGTTYQQIFCDWAFELFAGYEFNIWFNLHEVYRSTQAASPPGNPIETRMSNGLLGLQGFTFRATFGF